MGRTHSSILVAVTAFALSSTALAQFGTGSPVNVEPLEEGPAPVRDLSGVWTRIAPEGAFRSGSTWTPEPPKLTDWGEERFATARDSNAQHGAIAQLQRFSRHDVAVGDACDPLDHLIEDFHHMLHRRLLEPERLDADLALFDHQHRHRRRLGAASRSTADTRAALLPRRLAPRAGWR